MRWEVTPASGPWPKAPRRIARVARLLPPDARATKARSVPPSATPAWARPSPSCTQPRSGMAAKAAPRRAARHVVPACSPSSTRTPARRIFSAGNTGGRRRARPGLGRLEGVSRPALAAFFPNVGHGTVVLDVGANAEVKSPWLVQFAHMGRLPRATCSAREPARRAAVDRRGGARAISLQEVAAPQGRSAPELHRPAEGRDCQGHVRRHRDRRLHRQRAVEDRRERGQLLGRPCATR
jgi:hypothetical protein